jgi:hypothetical protein
VQNAAAASTCSVRRVGLGFEINMEESCITDAKRFKVKATSKRMATRRHSSVQCQISDFGTHIQHMIFVLHVVVYFIALQQCNS